jgi:SAM-dependent methyltransferase
MSYEQHILAHYKAQAELSGLSKQSTMHDEYIRDSEVRFITGEVRRGLARWGADASILELGCGNGYLLSVLEAEFPETHFQGLEYTSELFALAQSRGLQRTTLRQGDCREQNYPAESFHAVITERVLINLMDREHQLTAARRVAETLRPGGLFIMVECFDEPQANLNTARTELVLPPIPPAHHNLYLDEAFCREMAGFGLVEKEGQLPPNFLSTHYFNARVLHELLRPEGGAIRNTQFVKFFDTALPPAVGNYAAVLFRLFEKTA